MVLAFSCVPLRSRLLCALLREKQLAEQVLEREEDEAEERDSRDPDLYVEVCDADREQGGGELGRQHGDHELSHLVHQRAALEVTAVKRDDQEVHGERDHEGAEHHQVEEPVVAAKAGGVGRSVEGKPSDQWEPGIREQVVDEEVGLVAPAEPAHGDRGNADHGGRGAA